MVRDSRVTHHWSARLLAGPQPKGGASGGGGTKRKGADAEAEAEGESGRPPTMPCIVRIDPVAIAGAANQVRTNSSSQHQVLLHRNKRPSHPLSGSF